MLELPELIIMTRQLNDLIINKKIVGVVVNQTKNKLALDFDDSKEYMTKLLNESVKKCVCYGSFLAIETGNVEVIIREALEVSYRTDKYLIPPKHQLLLKFHDHTNLSFVISDTGFLACAKRKDLRKLVKYDCGIDILSKEFTYSEFKRILTMNKNCITVKDFLLENKSFFGIGTGVCQDVLYNAQLHPESILEYLNEDNRVLFFNSIKFTLKQMIDEQGRDTEVNVFGERGGYPTLMSEKSFRQPCYHCGVPITKISHVGSEDYVCLYCQKLIVDKKNKVKIF